MSKFAKI